MTSRRLAGALVVFAAATVVAASAQTDQGTPAPVSFRAGVERYTAVVQGVVTAADSGAPVQGAEVRLVGNERHRLTATDAAGRYAFTDLPPERMTLHVSKAGFAAAEYGQRHPLEDGEPIALTPGQQVTANLRLSRGGVIFGRVFDEYGEPAAGVRVQALRARSLQGRGGLQAVGSGDQADDTGAFRLHGLVPGTYYVSASAPFEPTFVRLGTTGSVNRGAPTYYYPDSPTVEGGLPVRIDETSQVPVSITIGTAPLARVSGVVVSAAGVPLPGLVTLVSQDRIATPGVDGPASLLMGGVGINETLGPEGQFTLDDVPPGSYVLTARLLPATRISRPQEVVSVPVLVSGEDVAGLTLVTRPRPMLSGRFVAAPGVSQPLPVGLGVLPLSQRLPVQRLLGLGERGTFEVLAPPEPFVLVIGQGLGGQLPPGWSLSAIRLNGRDVTDETIEVTSDATIEVVLTDRATTVNGTVRAGRGDDAANASVVVFPRDDSRWTYPSRAIRSARTDTSGRFEITGLPPGQRYLAAAVDYLVDGEEFDVALLDSLRPDAIGFALDEESDRRTLRLDLVTR